MQGKIMIRSFSIVALSSMLLASPASAVVYCETVGVPKICVARPAAAAAPVSKGQESALRRELALALPVPALIG